MKNSEQPAPPNDGLEFPDWSEMQNIPIRPDPEAAFQWVEENFRLFRGNTLAWHQERLERKCAVEFVL